MRAASTLLIAGLAAVAAANGRPALRPRGTGVCTGPDFVAQVGVGGTGPAFCESSWGGSYVPITNITVYSNSEIVTGMQVTYADGTPGNMLGNQAATVKSTGVNYAFGDLWTRVSMYGGEGDKSFVEHLLLNTTSGALINSGAPVNSGSSSLPRHDQPVGTGILFGVHGTYGANGQINSLYFLFLDPPISSISIDNVQFPDGPIGSNADIAPDVLVQDTVTNNTPDNVTYSFSNTVTVTQSYQYTQTYISAFAVANAQSYTLSLNILGITAGGGGSTTYTWTTTNQYATQYASSQAIGVTYTTSIPLQPGQSANCTAVAGQGTGTFPYTSTVTLTLQNGDSYSFTEDGQVKIQAYSQGSATCDPN